MGFGSIPNDATNNQMTENQRKQYPNWVKAGVKAMKLLSKQFIKDYNSKPCYCLECDRKLPYEKRNNSFCDSSCSASYNNRNKKMSDSHKENISKALKKRAQLLGYKPCKCKSCSTETERTKYCTICYDLHRYVKLFKKLDINDTNLINANKKAINKLKIEYFENEKSLTMLKNEYGIMLNTLSFFFKKNKINARSLSNANMLGIKLGRHNVPHNKKYKSGSHTTWFGEKIYYRSSYEKRVIDLLDSLEELYLYEKIRLPYKDEKGVNRTYVVDFFIPKYNLILETKSEWLQSVNKVSNNLKKRSAIKFGYKFIMIGKKQIELFEKSKDISLISPNSLKEKQSPSKR